MPRKVYSKLIRDKIPEIIKQEGGNPTVFELGEEQFKQALKSKLAEEAQELIRAKSPAELRNELCDILELVEAIAENDGIALEELQQEKAQKKEKKGGFNQRLFLEYVDE